MWCPPYKEADEETDQHQQEQEEPCWRDDPLGSMTATENIHYAKFKFCRGGWGGCEKWWNDKVYIQCHPHIISLSYSFIYSGLYFVCKYLHVKYNKGQGRWWHLMPILTKIIRLKIAQPLGLPVLQDSAMDLHTGNF